MVATIRLAQKKDKDVIVQLLRKARMNAVGVDKPATQFLLAEKASEEPEKRQLIGTVGVEFFGPCALLRSFVLTNGVDHARLGLEMIRIVLAYVEQQNVGELYMVTPTPSAFFTQLGFSEIGWEALPRDIRQCEHLQRTDRIATPMVYRY